MMKPALSTTRMTEISEDSKTLGLIREAAAGDEQAWHDLMTRHRKRLRSMVALRMDRRLQGRVDPSDVIQEACIVAARHLPEYAANPNMSFYLWLRWIAGQRLIDQHRRHLGAKARGVDRELSLYHGAFPEATTADLAAHLLGRLSTPSKSAMRIETKIRLQEALNSLEPMDREILALRHFEELTNGEAAEVLSIDKSAASKRYARALVRLKDVLLPMLGLEPDL
jgi:RNA polymerase sigma-70 factor (ECF subfamily)